LSSELAVLILKGVGLFLLRWLIGVPARSLSSAEFGLDRGVGDALPTLKLAAEIRFCNLESSFCTPGSGDSPRLTLPSTILWPTCRPKSASPFFMLFPLPLLERFVTAFFPCINEAEGGGSFIQARSSRLAGTVLTTGGCKSLTGGARAG
jgi:hypothetical protein